MPSSRIRATATMLLLGALIAPAASAASAVGAESTSPPGRTPSPASYTARVADPTDDVYTEETEVEETLRLSDLSEVTYKVDRVSRRVVVTYVVPEVHRVPFLGQIFTTTLYRPTKASRPERILGGFSAVLYAQRERTDDGRAYSRQISAGTPDGSGRPGCRRARATIDRASEETDHLVLSVPLRCLGRTSLPRGTAAQSGTRVDDYYGEHLAFDNTERVVVVPRR